jgi:hypothetical protein
MKPQFMLNRDLDGHTKCVQLFTIETLAADSVAVVLNWSFEESRDGTRRSGAAIAFSDRSLK